MRTPKAIMAAAAYCAAASTACSGFQPTATPRPTVASSSFFSLRAAAAAGGVDVRPADDDDDAATDGVDVDRRSPERENAAGSTSSLSSEAPRSLGPKRTFLGLRRESGAVRRMLEQQRQTSSSSSALSSSATALMPDGGLSPCVIKVLGVGGGGSNAVRRPLSSYFLVG